MKAPQIAPLLGLEVRHTFQLFKDGKLPNRGTPRDVWCYRSDVEVELERRRRQQRVRAAPKTHGMARSSHPSQPAAAAADPADSAWLLHLGLSPHEPDAGAGDDRPSPAVDGGPPAHPAAQGLPPEQLAAAALLDTPGMTEAILRAVLVRALVRLALGPGTTPEQQAQQAQQVQQARLTAEADALVGHWLAFPPGPGRAGQLQDIARGLRCKVTGLARLGLVRELGTA